MLGLIKLTLTAQDSELKKQTVFREIEIYSCMYKDAFTVHGTRDDLDNTDKTQVINVI